MTEEEPALDGEDLSEEESSGAVGRLRRLGRKLIERKELADDTRELLGAMLETSDRAKTEVVKMVAREVRTYLQELRVMDDLKDIMTSHSLELRMSMNLKPLAETLGSEDASATVEDEETVESIEETPNTTEEARVQVDESNA